MAIEFHERKLRVLRERERREGEREREKESEGIQTHNSNTTEALSCQYFLLCNFHVECVCKSNNFNRIPS